MGTLRRPRGSRASLEGRSQPPGSARRGHQLLPERTRPGWSSAAGGKRRCHPGGGGGRDLGSGGRSSPLSAVPWAGGWHLCLSFLACGKAFTAPAQGVWGCGANEENKARAQGWAAGWLGEPLGETEGWVGEWAEGCPAEDGGAVRQRDAGTARGPKAREDGGGGCHCRDRKSGPSN